MRFKIENVKCVNLCYIRNYWCSNTYRTAASRWHRWVGAYRKTFKLLNQLNTFQTIQWHDDCSIAFSRKKNLIPDSQNDLTANIISLNGVRHKLSGVYICTFTAENRINIEYAGKDTKVFRLRPNKTVIIEKVCQFLPHRSSPSLSCVRARVFQVF